MVDYFTPGPADGVELAAMAQQSFVETFGNLYTPDDLAAFCRQTFGAETGIPAELHDPNLIFRAARDQGRIVGFAKMSARKLPVADAAPDAMELRQLYVLAERHGKGIAQELMAWALDTARGRGASELYLSVYSDNHRAQRFYARYGFVDVGPYAFMVGNQADEDRIWKLTL